MVQSREEELYEEIISLMSELEEAEEDCNKWRKAFNIVMEYSIYLPECDYDKMTKRLKAIGIQ